MSKNTHYFYAVSLPSEAKRLLQEETNRLKEELSFSRWVHQEDYHITLAFLGFAPQEQLHKSIAIIEKKLKNNHSFPLLIQGLGTFGRNDSPRIFWADVEHKQALHNIRNEVYSACVEAGFELEKRPFKPHLTLARKWTGETSFNPESLMKMDIAGIPFEVTEVVLYQTHLDRTPKYEAVHTFSLHNRS
ncbi:RNA 2',3'-cyclic phosphodiesterase [Bacillus sp. 31A1R]|uniref:RNA 2',3'-cyclic phosphodiesterase n=1 Tax=Robertmurraya mangrovi TaxID=3098077 RepID=A0ABU5IZH5_9BACI|nr:RNA 2',3'-cyclic phosphodiesterase [Bacillus sp. 31A1R]MDZ5472573.1 RNA 2',3'-cyclic phosphodiesterase [Bacillus sp. 31A1R]